MGRLRLTLAAWDYDRVRPLFDGSIQPEGIEIAPIVSRPSETFFRMLRHQEFDVSELSFSNYTMLRASGDDTFVAIPVFPFAPVPPLVHLREHAGRHQRAEGPRRQKDRRA